MAPKKLRRKTTAKDKPARAERGARKTASASSAHNPPNDASNAIAESMIAANAQALGLTIEPSWYAGITFNIGLILRLASLVDTFPLADDAEPASVFHA